MQKRRLGFELDFEVEMLGLAVDMTDTLSKELDVTAERFNKKIVAGDEINVEEVIHKLNFINKVFYMHSTNLNAHYQEISKVAKAIREINK